MHLGVSSGGSPTIPQSLFCAQELHHAVQHPVTPVQWLGVLGWHLGGKL